MIVDFKRPTSFLAKSVITLLMHGGLRVGVQDLSPLLAGVGFSQMTGGEMGWRPLGYVRALAQKAGEKR